MAKHTATVLLLLCCTALTAQARLLQQATPNTRCPAGCADNACVLDSTSGGYKCTKCKGSLVVNAEDGTCQCPAGRYATTETCVDCDKGSFCLGGQYTAPNTPDKTACPNSLTTIGRRSTTKKACVNLPGAFYTVDISGEPGQSTCPVDTYGPGLRKQRACVPCPPGYSTKGLTGKTTSRDCYVPPGYYLKGPGQVAPCPKGEYKSGYDAVAACSKCAEGVTTLAEASTNQAACVSVLPTYYPSSIQTLVVDNATVGDYVASTKKCPQKFYCAGGQPTAKFDPATPALLDGTTVAVCPHQTWTENTGASAESQCMTPPGFKTVGDVTDACPSGTYRADWKPAAQAGSCDECGANIESDTTDEITSISISDYTATTKVYVRASASACYIKAGQGMYFSPATSKYTAVNCSTNNYGVASTTYGLAAYPCRDCPAGMQTSVSLSASAAFNSDNGFTSPMACVTKAGYGYNGRVANKCPAGSYNGAGNYGTCTQCPVGYSTPDAAESQVAQSDCSIAVGYGFYDNAVIPCPVGTYNSELRNTTTAQCDSCPNGLTTAQAGGRSSDDCNVCKPGFGGASCASECGGSAATFGVAGRPVTDPACDTCPTMTTGFSFDFEAVNQPFTPAAVARSRADSAADCLAEFAQIADAAWYMGGSAALDNITASVSANTFDACVAACKGATDCQYVTYLYDTKECLKKSAGNATNTGDVLAFKAVVAGDTTAASKSTESKALASGSYTFWKETAVGVGASSTTVTVDSLQACLSACDSDAACAAVAITGATSNAAAPIGSCSLIKGDSRVAQFKRSVTKAVATRLQVAAAL